MAVEKNIYIANFPIETPISFVDFPAPATFDDTRGLYRNNPQKSPQGLARTWRLRSVSVETLLLCAKGRRPKRGHHVEVVSHGLSLS